MKKHKLIRLFWTLTDSELRTLKLFVRSPFYNRRTDVIQLFDVLRKEKNYEKLSAEKLFYKIYPEEDFEKQKLAYVMSYLLKVIEQYLVHQESNRQNIQQQFYLIQAYKRRNLKKDFQQKIEKTKQLLEEQEVQNLKAHYNHYYLGMEHYDVQKNQQRAVQTNLQEVTDHLDVYLMGKKLHQACILLTHSSLSNQEYQLGILDSILSYLDAPAQQHLLNIPSLAIWYHALNTLIATNKEAHFGRLKQLLFQYSKYFEVNERSDFYQIALNFCIKRLNQGQQVYVRAAFELYRKGLDENIFFEDDYLSQFTYKNIIALGLGLQEFVWVKGFIHGYKEKLEPQNRENNFNYNLARWHYEQSNYNEALLLLQAVKFQDILPNLTAKVLQSKIYYDLEEEEVLYHFLRSFEHQLRRQNRLGYHKTYYLNFIKTIQKITQLNRMDKVAVNDLFQQISNMEKLPEKKWLLEKLI